MKFWKRSPFKNICSTKNSFVICDIILKEYFFFINAQEEQTLSAKKIKSYSRNIYFVSANTIKCYYKTKQKAKFTSHFISYFCFEVKYMSQSQHVFFLKIISAPATWEGADLYWVMNFLTAWIARVRIMLECSPRVLMIKSS